MGLNFVEQLPEELALAVLQHLSFEDRARACCVNSTWDKLTREQAFGPPTLELRPKLVRSTSCSILMWCKELSFKYTIRTRQLPPLPLRRVMGTPILHDGDAAAEHGCSDQMAHQSHNSHML